jgi:Flp pilus assembly pilin Flp
VVHVWSVWLRTFLTRARSERGAVSTEYVIIVATLAVAALAAAGIIAAKVISKANGIGL